MDHERLELLLRLWVVVAITAGIAAVIFGGRNLAIVGVLLIIFGLISLMPAFHSYVGEWEVDFIE